MARFLVTGGAGFIGSHLVDALRASGHEVVVLDNFSSGKREFVSHHERGVQVVEGDLTDLETVKAVMPGVDVVYHLAANPDIRYGIAHTDWDLRQNLISTYNVLEAMRLAETRAICFASTSAVYGEAVTVPTPESYGPCLPMSLYGASKLAAEGLISSFVGTFGFQAWIYRFANIVGPRTTHGVVLDFVEKLRKDPNRLEILGDGRQSKSYLHVSELVDAMEFIRTHAAGAINLYNCGSGDRVSVREIAGMVAEEMGLEPEFQFTGGLRGWPGDVPTMLLDTAAARELGWSATRTSREAVRQSVRTVVAERLRAA
jgi:UDP-glucose 4-epimerase